MVNSSGRAAVHANGLHVVRGGRQVLTDLAFTVPRGSVTGLLGPSGCGKTTLMRAVAGTQAKVTGTLDVLGHPAGSAPLRSRLGYVAQAPSVYADLTTRQNLDYFGSVLGLTKAERQHRVAEVLLDVDLTSHAEDLTAKLSGGQQSRVSLAVALLGQPELLVLDEPTVGLDPVLRRDLWNLFHRLAAERGTTLLISSHVMDEADRCERLLLMRAGRLLADDTPQALRARAPRRDHRGRLPPARGRGPRTRDDRAPNPPSTPEGPGQTMITNVSTRRGTNGALSARRALATARRVTRQLSHDRRTLALLLLLPVLLLVLLVLLYYVFDADRQAFDSIGASLLGIFPMITMFLVRNIQPRLAACKALTCANAIV